MNIENIDSDGIVGSLFVSVFSVLAGTGYWSILSPSNLLAQVLVFVGSALVFIVNTIALRYFWINRESSNTEERKEVEVSRLEVKTQ